MNKKITKRTTLSEILKYPEVYEILKEYEVPCLGCPMARFEMDSLTLEQITKQYNINIDGLLKALNSVIIK